MLLWWLARRFQTKLSRCDEVKTQLKKTYCTRYSSKQPPTQKNAKETACSTKHRCKSVTSTKDMVFKEVQHEVGVSETYSHSSAEDEYEDEMDMEDDHDDEEEEDDEAPFWKQHWVAIVVGIAATIASHWYNTSVSLNKPANLFPFLETSTSKHAHVDGFVRTANISFCGQPVTKGPLSLELMDFYIPMESYDALQGLYHADVTQDDYNEIVPQRMAKGLASVELEDSKCLSQQQQDPHPSGKIQGFTHYYRQPTLQEIYPEPDGPQTKPSAMSRQRRLQQPPLVFTGFAAKFVNMSPKPVLLYWDGKGGHANAKKLVGEIAPFESLGTATMPGHSFHVTQVFDSSEALQRWVVTADTSLIFFETHTPMEMKDLFLKNVPDKEPDYKAFAMYQQQLINQAFAREYLIASKRNWLAHFPRHFPMHFMHQASYIGQTHMMGDFSLKVVSVAPRVLVIDNFLQPEECQNIIAASQEQGLEHSTLHSGATVAQTRDLSTRSSSNTWLPRDTSALTEKVYQQAAEVMGLDPELFQKYHDSSAHHNSIAESLQVVRYKKGGEEYQPHHDFVYPSVNHRYQPTRFATLLMYLNDVPEGGETRFPRAVNNYNARGLEIKPKAGRAVLFYNLLEDGNVDDLSQHGSNPTTEHEKWLANLWVWDPIID